MRSYCSLLLFQRDCVLRDLIEGCNGFGVGLKAALGYDQVGEFGGNVYVRQFQRTPGNRSPSSRAGHSDYGRTGSQSGCVSVLPLS